MKFKIVEVNFVSGNLITIEVKVVSFTLYTLSHKTPISHQIT